MERLYSGDSDALIMGAAGYFAFMGLIAFARMFLLSRWPSVVGVLHEEGIEGSDIGAISLDEREYMAIVRYSYSIDGLTYQSTRLNAWHVTASHNLRALLKYQLRGIERHEGAKVTVFYNPRKPQKSYLEVPGWRSMVLVVGLCFGSAALILSAL